MNPDLTRKLAALPADPGVYLFRDAAGVVRYIGKAKNLRHRVRSYFQAARDLDPKTALLVSGVHDLEYIVTASEYEAFVLESNLIRHHKPRFNIHLKDDKTFPFIKVTVQDTFPRISLTRRPGRDGARYFGPYLSGVQARHLIDLIRATFGVRHCRADIDGTAERFCCLDAQTHRCLGPCVTAHCDPDTYRRAVGEALLFLEGRRGELSGQLETRMRAAAAELRYEEAAGLRDRLSALTAAAERQQVYLAGEADSDVFASHTDGTHLAVQVFHMRGGRLADRRQFFWDDPPTLDPTELWPAFLQQFYVDQPVIPPRLLLPLDLPSTDLTGAWLRERRGGAVRLLHPRRGALARLLALAERNARVGFLTRFPKAGQGDAAIAALARTLGLPHPPHRIEAFDISNTGGVEVVAAMVVGLEGRPEPAHYRRFRVRGVVGQADDFASLAEVVGRRYTRLLREEGRLPDLVLVDGGPGQVGSAQAALTALGLDDLPLCGLAKGEETIHLPGRAAPLRLARHDPALRLLQQLRDEAHRFALTYHRRRRAGRSRRSPLDDIAGLGPVRRQALLRRFGSLTAVLSATPEELAAVLGPRVGPGIHARLHPPEAP